MTNYYTKTNMQTIGQALLDWGNITNRPNTIQGYGISLSSGSIFIGDASNNAIPQIVSGDASLNNSGILTIAPNSVNSSKILDGTITDNDISSSAGIIPSKIFGTAWTSQNDGSGSGLDADLFDGQNSSSFGLIPASQTWTGINTFSNPNNSFSGNGINITGLNASNILSGALSDDRLSVNVTKQGNIFNIANKLVQLDASTRLPAVDGSLLTNISITLQPNSIYNSHINTSADILPSKLKAGEVWDNANASPIITISNNVYNDNERIGIRGKCIGSSGTSSAQHAIGIEGISEITTGYGEAMAGRFLATGGLGYKVGVAGYTEGSSASPYYHAGIYGLGKNVSSGDAYGGYFEVFNSGSGNHFGIYAKVVSGSNHWAGLFDGKVKINGALEVTGGITGCISSINSQIGPAIIINSTNSSINLSSASNTISLTTNFSGSGSANTSSRSDHNHSITNDYIQNQSSLNQTANFKISGNGVANHFEAGSFSSSLAAIQGQSSTLSGLYGESTNSNGIYGKTSSTNTNYAGIYGTNVSSSAGCSGIYGQSSNGPGVYGLNATTAYAAVTGNNTTIGTGVYGYSIGTGVFGQSNGSNGTGIYGLCNLGTNACGVYGSSSTGYAGYFLGKVTITGILTKGGGAFLIDHPLDPENKYLYHSFVESPDMKNIYDGIAELDENGNALVILPDYFESLNKDYRYQLTCIGKFSHIYIAEEINGNKFKIAGGEPSMKVSWQVTGTRKDPFANSNRIIPEVEKEPENKGKYLHPKEYGKSEESRIDKGIKNVLHQ